MVDKSMTLFEQESGVIDRLRDKATQAHNAVSAWPESPEMRDMFRSLRSATSGVVTELINRREFRRDYVKSNPLTPENWAQVEATLSALHGCALSWAPEVCLLGNVTARDIAFACVAATHLIPGRN